MDAHGVISLVQQAMQVMLIVVMPLLLVSLVTGLIVSIFQAATQINEATLSFLPKLVAILATMIIAGPWMIQLLVDYMQRLLGSIPTIIR
jgi:flagellar biosynthetic protein FliQ